MGLNKILVPVPLGLSINTGDDPFQMNGGLLNLENSYVQKTGKLQKRAGYEQLNNETLDGYNDIESAIKIATFGDELVLLSPTAIYTWAPASEKWVFKGTSVFTEVGTEPIIANSYEQLSPDMSTAQNVAVYAWEDSRGGVRATVRDLSSTAVLISDTELNANGTRPRCFAIGDYLFVFYYDTVLQDLIARRVSIHSPDSFSSEVVVANDINTSTPYFDVCAMGANMLVAFRNTTSDLRLLYFLQTNAVGTVLNGVPDPFTISAEDPDRCIGVFAGQAVSGTNTFDVVWCNSTAGIKHMAFYDDFTTYKAAVVVDASDTTARNITGINYQGDAYSYSDIFYETQPGTAMDAYVTYGIVEVETAAVSHSVLQRAAGLASKPYIANDQSSIIVSFQSTSELQDTYFAINVDGQVEAKILPQVSGGHTAKVSNVPGIWLDTSNEYLFACGRKTRIVVDQNESFSLTNINQTSLNYDSVRLGLPAQLGLNLHIPGGFVRQYDGLTITEHNFHMYPEQPAIAAGSSGSVGNGTYLYTVVWEWIDAQGQLEQSTTSVPKSHTVSGGAKNPVLTIPTLRYTDKKAAQDRTPVVISVYRTENNGTISYKVSNDSSPTYNDTSVDTVTFTDTITDVALISRPLLYTTGNVLDNAPSPACTVIKTAKNRVFSAGLDSGSEIAYSKQFTDGRDVAFADEFRLQIDARGGNVTALAEMDANLIIFKRAAIFNLTGNGPLPTGEADDFQVNFINTGEVGCIEPESVVETTQGIMFKSERGIWLLDQGLKVHYIGKRVESYNDLNVSSAISVPDQNQVRFTTEEGTTLVYDYYFNIWTSFTTLEAIAAVAWQGNYVFAKDTGRVWQETPDEFNDAGAPIDTVIETNWFDLTGLAGYQRAYKAVLLGEYVGAHRLKVEVYYDFETVLDPRNVYTYTPDDNGFGDTYDTGATYASQPTYGLTYSTYMLELCLRRQKCTSIRFVIRDLFPESTGTGSFNISSITLQIGAKKGTNRLPRSRRMSN